MRPTEVKAAWSVADISPSEEVDLGAGYYSAPEWTIYSRPELNFLALWVGDDDPVVFVSVDALYPGAALRRTIEAALPSVPVQNIVVGASHTHSAPMLDDTKPRLGRPDLKHLSMVLSAARKCAAELMEPDNRVPVRLLAAKENADHSVNRRQLKLVMWQWPLRFNTLRWAPDFWGRRDETTTTLVVENMDGEAVAVMWNYACHPVMFPIERSVSTHFPGRIRDRIRAEYGLGLPVVFYQGFSGDTRPLMLAEPRFPASVRHFYRRIRFGTDWDPEQKGIAEWEAWSDSLGRHVMHALSRVRPIEARGYRSERLLVERTQFVQAQGAPLSFQALRIGDSFGLVAVSGEMVVEYAKRARKWLDTKYSMMVGCADDTMGYVPTTKMMLQGGYEGGRFVENFDLIGLNPALEHNTVRSLRSVIEAV